MFEADLPFDHKTMHLKLEDKNFAGLMEGHQNEFKPEASQEELVEKSLDNPYGSPKLEELCRGKRDIVIISSDHTRPVPSRVTMPILLRRIHAAAPEARVRILVATACTVPPPTRSSSTSTARRSWPRKRSSCTWPPTTP